MRTVEVLLPDGSLLCRAEVAEGFVTRGVGLLGRRSLGDGAGLLIDPCTSVHTMFMRFPIDVLFLDRDNVVVKAVKMPVFRMAMGGKAAKRALELPRGTIDTRGIRPGDALSIQ